jgi:hypothetical protein
LRAVGNSRSWRAAKPTEAANAARRKSVTPQACLRHDEPSRRVTPLACLPHDALEGMNQ